MQTLELISTKKKVALLGWLLSNAGDKIRVRQIAKTLKINPGYVSSFISKLKKEGLVQGTAVSISNPMVKALKIAINIEKVAKAAEKISRKPEILGLGVYGSWAKGTNNQNSDLDIWIKLKKELPVDKISELRKILRDHTGSTEVSIIALTNEKISVMKQGDSIFYSTLLNSFHISGEFID